MERKKNQMSEAVLEAKKASRKKSNQKDARKFENPYGYFTADGREFVITRPDTPRP